MRFRKFLNPYKTRDSSFREYTVREGAGTVGRKDSHYPYRRWFRFSRKQYKVVQRQTSDETVQKEL